MSVAEVPEARHTERMANLGESCELKKLGRVTVRELTLENTIALARELSIVFGAIDIDLAAPPGERRGFEWIMTLLGDPASQQAIRAVAAASTGKEPEDFEGMGLGDWFKIVAAFKTAMDWEELKELFFQIVPQDTMQSLMKATSPLRAQE